MGLSIAQGKTKGQSPYLNPSMLMAKVVGT